MRNYIPHYCKWLVPIIICLLSIFMCFGIGFTKASASDTADKDRLILLDGSGKQCSPIFTEEDGLWAPGVMRAKFFFLENLSSEDFVIDKIALTIKLMDGDGNRLPEDSDVYREFLKTMATRIEFDGKVLYSGNFYDLREENYELPKMTNISSKSKKPLEVTVAMDKTGHNSIQGLKGIADISLCSHSIDKESTGGSIVKTGYFMDYKLLTIIGISMLCVGVVMLLKNKIIVQSKSKE